MRTAKHWCPSLTGWIKTKLGIGVSVRLAGSEYAKHWRPGLACWVKAGSALVSPSRLLDENRLGNGVPFWFAGWDENKLSISVRVKPAGLT